MHAVGQSAAPLLLPLLSFRAFSEEKVVLLTAGVTPETGRPDEAHFHGESAAASRARDAKRRRLRRH